MRLILNEKLHSGQTALSNVVRVGKVEILELLLERGADLKKALPQSNPISEALVNRQVNALPAINILLEYGAEVGADGRGSTPLYVARHPSHKQHPTDMAKVLEELRVSETPSTKSFPTTKHILSEAESSDPTARQRFETHLAIIDEKNDPKRANDTLDSGWTEFQAALAINNRSFLPLDLTESIKTMIKKGADPNAADPDGWTPLGRAAIHGNNEVFMALVEAGADIAAQACPSDQRAFQLETKA